MKTALFKIGMVISLLLPGIAHAGLIHHFSHSYLGGGVVIDLDVFDGDTQTAGNPLRWEYTVYNHGYDPNPGTSNGFSGFELFLPSPIPEIANITDPAPGWVHNCCSGLPQEWDIRNSIGLGIMPGEVGTFSFTTTFRAVAINDNGWFHTWQNDRQTDIITTLGMHVPWVPGLTPLPEPATLALLSLGLAGFGFSRRKRI